MQGLSFVSPVRREGFHSDKVNLNVSGDLQPAPSCLSNKNVDLRGELHMYMFLRE